MRTPRLVSLTIGLVLVSVLATASGTAAHAATKTSVYDASATLSGPITAGHIIEPASGVSVNLAAHGYVEQEFFASGTAHAFTATSAPANGRWSIKPSTSASYKTRIIVRRPATASKFNGTVVVEWMNVSGGSRLPTGTISIRCWFEPATPTWPCRPRRSESKGARPSSASAARA